MNSVRGKQQLVITLYENDDREVVDDGVVFMLQHNLICSDGKKG